MRAKKPHLLRLRTRPGVALPIPAKILIADDQPIVLRNLRSLLSQQHHWRIYEARSGEAALEWLDAIKPDVAVLDIVMEEMDGIETAYEIRKRVPETKIILISSHYTPQDAPALAHLFGDGNFIQKSEMGIQLIPAINRLLPEEKQTAKA
jgi:DNA-binding NarL/FixJ family response regulator